MSLVDNMIGVIAPMITGILVGATDSFVITFVAAGVVLLIGVVSSVSVLGRFEPIHAQSGANTVHAPPAGSMLV